MGFFWQILHMLSVPQKRDGRCELVIAGDQLAPTISRMPSQASKKDDVAISIYAKNFVINCDLLKPQAFSRQPNPHNCSMVASRE